MRLVTFWHHFVEIDGVHACGGGRASHRMFGRRQRRHFVRHLQKNAATHVSSDVAIVVINLHSGLKWVKIDVLSTGSFAPLFARLLAPLTHLLAPHCSLRSRAPLRSFVLSLARSRAPELMVV